MRKSAIIAGLLLVAVAGYVFLAPKEAPAAPVITWTPEKVEESVYPGTKKLISVSFVASEDVEDAQIWIVPELSELLRVDSPPPSHVERGTTVTVRFIMSPPFGVTLGVRDGTLHLRSGGKTVSRPLPVLVHVSQVFANHDQGFTITIPASLPLAVGTNSDTSWTGFFNRLEDADNLIPPVFFVTVSALDPSVSLEEWVRSFAGQDVTLRTIEGSQFLKWHEVNEDEQVVTYSTRWNDQFVLDISTESKSFSESPEFLNIVSSLKPIR